MASTKSLVSEIDLTETDPSLDPFDEEIPERGNRHLSGGEPRPSSGIRPVPTTKPHRRTWAWAVMALAGAAAIAVGIKYYFYACGFESTDDAFIDGHIVPVSSRVAGHVAKVYVTDNQWVNEGDLVAELDPRDFESRLASAEAGLSAARAGLKSRSFGVNVTEITSTAGVDEASAGVAGARASVETAKAAVATAKSTQAQTQAQVAVAKAAWKQAQADLPAAEARQQRAAAFLKRIQALVPSRAAAQDTLDEAVAAEQVATADVAAVRQRIAAQEAVVDQAEAAVTAAESGVRQAEAGVAAQMAAQQRTEAQLAATKSGPQQVAQSRSQSDVAEADIAHAEAELHQAKLNLSYTKIYAPLSGHVTRKSVEPGAYVQTGQPLLALVEPNVWVTANFKETQLDHMQPGQAVSVTVDAHPAAQFTAHIDSIQRGSGARFSLLPPENATGNFVKVVQRVPVKIVFDDLSQVQRYALGPGMSVVPTITLGKSDKTTVTASR